MLCVTTQHPDVLISLLRDGEYDPKCIYNPELKQSYEFDALAYKQFRALFGINENEALFWVMVHPNSDKKFRLTKDNYKNGEFRLNMHVTSHNPYRFLQNIEEKISLRDDKGISKALELRTCANSSWYELLLDIPEEYLVLTDYYTWSDFLSYINGNTMITTEYYNGETQLLDCVTAYEREKLNNTKEALDAFIQENVVQGTTHGIKIKREWLIGFVDSGNNYYNVEIKGV